MSGGYYSGIITNFQTTGWGIPLRATPQATTTAPGGISPGSRAEPRLQPIPTARYCLMPTPVTVSSPDTINRFVVTQAIS